MFETTLPLPLAHTQHGNGAALGSTATLEGEGCAMSHEYLDPLELARLMQRATDATRRSSPRAQKHYQRALELSKSRTSRHFNGDDPYAPIVHLLRAVKALAATDYTSAMPIIEEAMRLAREELARRSTEDLERRLAEYERRRIEADEKIRLAKYEEFLSGAQYGSEAVDTAEIDRNHIGMEISVLRSVLADKKREVSR